MGYDDDDDDDAFLRYHGSDETLGETSDKLDDCTPRFALLYLIQSSCLS